MVASIHANKSALRSTLYGLSHCYYPSKCPKFNNFETLITYSYVSLKLCPLLLRWVKNRNNRNLCGYGEGLSASINEGNFLTTVVYWLASQEGLCSMEQVSK